MTTTGWRRLGLVCAMPEEWRSLAPHVAAPRPTQLAGRRFTEGRIEGTDVVAVLAGIGKVAAAATTALLIDRFDVDAVLFTGVAGGLAEGVAVGDLVVARALLQHDMDASPLFPRHEVPGTGRSRFDADARLSNALAAAAQAALVDDAARVGVTPRVHQGLVVSGDRFVSTAAESASLRAQLPDALAVEMEGAAAAQVCHDFGRPFAMLRTISDRADDAAHVDFQRFVEDVAAEVTHRVVVRMLGGHTGRGAA